MSELADNKAKAVKDQKNRLVATTKAGEIDDLRPTVDVWRDGRMLAGIVCPDVDRDQALHAAHLAVPGFNADAVVLGLDAHMTNQPTNPSTGRPWGPREMQGLCDNENACDTGVITDCMMVNEVGRDFSWAMVIQPYHVHKTARTIAWFPDITEMSSDTDGTAVEGLVVDALRAAFDKPDLLSIAIGEYPEELPPNVRLHTDLAVIKMLLAQNYMVAYSPANEEEAAIVNESLTQFTATKGVMDLVTELEQRKN